jgi:hypothetical protein
MKNFINKHFRYFGAFFLLQFKHFLPYFLFVNVGIILVVTGLSYFYLFAQSSFVNSLVVNSFWLFANIGGFVVTTSAFAQYGRKDSRMHLFLVPVSPFAKFLTAFIYAIPFYLLVVTGIYMLYANALAQVFSSFNFIKGFTFNPFVHDLSSDKLSFLQHFMFFVGIQSFTFLSGVFFPKMGFLKTVPAVAVLFMVYLFTNSISSHGELETNFLSNLYNILTNNTFENIDLRQAMPFITYCWWGITALLIPTIWYIAYLRFKEMVA